MHSRTAILLTRKSNDTNTQKALVVHILLKTCHQLAYLLTFCSKHAKLLIFLLKSEYQGIKLKLNKREFSLKKKTNIFQQAYCISSIFSWGLY